MRTAPALLIGGCASLWLDALAGGDLVAGTAALLVVAVLGLWTGLTCRVWHLAPYGGSAIVLLSAADHVHAGAQFTLPDDGLFYTVVVFGPLLIGGLIAGRNRQVALLQRRRVELEDRRQLLVQLAAAEEQERVAREVDGILAERLAAITRGVQAAVAADADRARIGLVAVECSARDALGDLRQVLGVLRNRPPESAVHSSVATTQRFARSSLTDAPSPSIAGRIDLLDAALWLAVLPLVIETSVPGHRGWWWCNAVLALVQGAALTLLRRRPLPGATLLIALAILQTAAFTPLPLTVSWFLPGLIAAYLIGVGDNTGTALRGLGVLSVGVSLMSVLVPSASRSFGGLIAGLVMGLIAWFGGRAVASRRHQASELERITDELELTADRAAELSAADQRIRLARELHDTGAHALTVVCLQAGAAQAWMNRDDAKTEQALAALVEMTVGPLAGLSDSLHVLARPGAKLALDADSLQGLAGLSRALGLRVEVNVHGSVQAVRPDASQVGYRLVQEALTNAARHAGRTDVRLDVEVSEREVRISVTDDGPPEDGSVLALPVSGSGLGLLGMRERVSALNGELTTGAHGSGFRVFARLPA